jgi:hypothetical protein
MEAVEKKKKEISLCPEEMPRGNKRDIQAL